MTDVSSFLDSLAKTWQRRLSDPLLGPLIAAIVGANWRFFYILAAGGDSGSLVAATAGRAWTWSAFWWGLAFAAAFVGVYPMVRVLIVRWATWWHVKALNAKRRIEDGDSLMTWAEAQEHPEYRRLSAAVNAWTTIYGNVIERIGFKGPPPASEYFVDAQQLLSPPCVAAIDPTNGRRLRRLRNMNKPDPTSLRYCFARVGQELMTAPDKGIVWWPGPEDEAVQVLECLDSGEVIVLGGPRGPESRNSKVVAKIHRNADFPRFADFRVEPRKR